MGWTLKGTTDFGGESIKGLSQVRGFGTGFANRTPHHVDPRRAGRSRAKETSCTALAVGKKVKVKGSRPAVRD